MIGGQFVPESCKYVLHFSPASGLARLKIRKRYKQVEKASEKPPAIFVVDSVNYLCSQPIPGGSASTAIEGEIAFNALFSHGTRVSLIDARMVETIFTFGGVCYSMGLMRLPCSVETQDLTWV